MIKIPIIFTFIFLGILGIKSQEYAEPLDIPLLLSGNFGELRSNHFHSGIDFKTQGKTGLPIRSVMDGYVSRVAVSPSGYGNVLYVNHPNGTTSVYAHLDRFAPAIKNFVSDQQYSQKKFKQDLSLSPEQFQIKKGDIIGYGGNTGSSGGPHLHFELRDTHTEEPFDALPFYMDKIKDSRKPEIRGIMIYPQPGEGIVNGRPEKQSIPITGNKQGKKNTTRISAWGKIGLSVSAYDYMNGTSNIYGVKFVSLSVDDEEIFSMNMDRFSFSETRYLNSLIDWEEWISKGSFYMKSFLDPGNLLRIYNTKNRGIIDICEERIYKFTYTLKDLHGNTTIFQFDILGKKQEINKRKPPGTYYRHDRDNHILLNNIELFIPKGNLYNDIYFTYSEKQNYTPYASLHNLYKRIPLHSGGSLSITLQNDTFPDKKKYGIVTIRRGRQGWIGGEYNAGKITANIRELGNYSVTTDTIAPTITELNPSMWTKNKTLEFKIKDELSGITQWEATLGGEFILFEYDAKKNRLFCIYDPGRMKSGNRILVLQVEDACGNRKVYEKEIHW